MYRKLLASEAALEHITLHGMLQYSVLKMLIEQLSVFFQFGIWLKSNACQIPYLYSRFYCTLLMLSVESECQLSM